MDQDRFDSIPGQPEACEDGRMETWQAINTIRVVRKFTDEPLKPEHLRRILNAGRRAASSKNE